MAKVLSVKYPWCVYIIYGSKDVENRIWKHPPKYRGRLYIHCGKQPDMGARIPVGANKKEELQLFVNIPNLAFDNIAGKIIGYVELDDMKHESDSPWYTGDLALMFSNPVALLEPIPYRGQLGFFNVDNALLGIE